MRRKEAAPRGRRLTNLLMVTSTIVIAASAVANLLVIRAQLIEMQASGHQTDKLIEVAAKLAVAADTQAAIAREQARISREQLEESTRQRQYTMAQLRANVRIGTVRVQPLPDQTRVREGARGWNISPVWKNFGATDARDFVSWWDLIVADTSSVSARQIEPSACPSPRRRNDPTTASVLHHDGTINEVSQYLRLEDATKATGSTPTARIFVVAHAEYYDNFPEKRVHRTDWCAIAVPSDIVKGEFSYKALLDSFD